MKLSYDPKANVAHIRLRERPVLPSSCRRQVLVPAVIPSGAAPTASPDAVALPPGRRDPR